MAEAQTLNMLNDPEMLEIVDSFLVETKEILEKLDLDLVNLENAPNDTELLNEIFRAFHTIKGTSGFLGLEKLTVITHKCEDILNKLRKGEAELNCNITDGILDGYDRIGELLSSIENNKNEDVPINETLNSLTGIINMLESKQVSPAQGKTERTSNSKKATAVKTKKSASAKKVIPQKTKRLPAKSERTESINQVEKRKAEQEEIAEVKNRISGTASLKDRGQSAVQKALGGSRETTIRVEIERLDELLNIVSELVLGRNRLAQVSSEFALEFEGTNYARNLFEVQRQIDLMTNELQLVVMKVRMVKIGKVFNKFPRLVRDLSRETGKEIELEIKGEDTELDKTLIEEINDPLVHLIRNSIDHGIEKPGEREKLGKGRIGSIKLDAVQEGNNIIITITDDGKGIDPEVIKNTAVEKGLISGEKAKELSEQDIYNLIFMPGFSTAKKVTNVSGRGVGMDVVKTNVSKLRGFIDIESKLGEGTKIIILLPLTLAIIHGMIVRVKSEKVVIPLNSIIEVLRINTKDVYKVNKKDVIKLRDLTVPLMSIDDILQIKRNGDKKDEYQNVVVVKIADTTFGIKVDELIGQKEVVIKSLGSYLGNLNGIAGSTIMGDGTVVMILDLSELMNQLT